MQRKVERECPACGGTYHADPQRLKHGRQTTCSRACSYQLRGQKKETSITLTCAVCGKEISRTPAQIKSKYGVHYCSRACHYARRGLGLTPRIVVRPYRPVAPPPSSEQIAKTVTTRRERDNYRHTDLTKSRLREAPTRNIAEGRIARVSRLEDEVAKTLDGLGVKYARQVGLRGNNGTFVAALDFMLADGRAIEVNSTFWNADPRVYPGGPVHPSQVRTAQRWDRKVSILRSCGITLVVVWESGFRNDAAETLRVALA